MKEQNNTQVYQTTSFHGHFPALSACSPNNQKSKDCPSVQTFLESYVFFGDG